MDNNYWELVTIYGGDVTAIGGENSAGIGGGEDRGNGRVIKLSHHNLLGLYDITVDQDEDLDTKHN